MVSAIETIMSNTMTVIVEFLSPYRLRMAMTTKNTIKAIPTNPKAIRIYFPILLSSFG